MHWRDWMAEAKSQAETLASRFTALKAELDRRFAEVSPENPSPHWSEDLDASILGNSRNRMQQIKQVMVYLRSGKAVNCRDDLVAWLENEFIEVRASFMESQESIISSLREYNYPCPYPLSNDTKTTLSSEIPTSGKRATVEEWKKNKLAKKQVDEEKERRNELDRRKEKRSSLERHKARHALMERLREEKKEEKKRLQVTEKNNRILERERRRKEYAAIEERIHQRNDKYLSRRTHKGMRPCQKTSKKENTEEILAEDCHHLETTKILLRRLKNLQ